MKIAETRGLEKKTLGVSIVLHNYMNGKIFRDLKLFKKFSSQTPVKNVAVVINAQFYWPICNYQGNSYNL